MAVGNALLDMYDEVQAEIAQKNLDKKQPPKKMEKPKTVSVKALKKDKPVCPECGEFLVFEGGCNVCKSCGWSKCM